MKRRKWNAKRLSTIALSLALILPGNIVFAEEADIVLPEGITVQQEIPEIDGIDGDVDFFEEEPGTEADESTPVDESETTEVTEPGDGTEAPESDPSNGESETLVTEVAVDEEGDSETAVPDDGADVNEKTDSDETLGYATTSDGFSWSVTKRDGTEVLILDYYKGTSTSVEIPETVDYGRNTYPVGYIRFNAFKGNSTITSVSIPKSVTSIGFSAFQNCVALKTVTLNEGLQGIGSRAFEGCSSLQSIVVPSTVTSIEYGAFSNCTAMTEAQINADVVGEAAFSGNALLEKVTLSSKTTRIDSNAFYNCVSLNTVNIPSSLSEIGKNAFTNCKSLKAVTLNEGLSVIEDEAFTGCTALEGIAIPSTVSTVGKNVFKDITALKKVDINSAIVGASMFQGCTNLQTLTLSDNLLNISERAFEGCTSLQSVDLPSELAVMGQYAFSNCDSLVSVTVPKSVTSIGNYAFSECDNLEKAYVNCTVVGAAMFENCPKLRKVMLGDGVITISGSAFNNDSSLSVIYIPESVKAINARAFLGSGLGSGTVYCEKGSTADNASWYPSGTTICYGRPQVAPPKFTVKGVFGGRDVTFTSETEGAVIYYSTESSNLTTSDIKVKNGKTVRFEDYYGTVYARAYYDDEWSNVAKLVLKIPVVNDPTITQEGSKVTVRCTTPDSYVYYTLDGSTPSMTNGIKIAPNKSASFELTTGGTVKAIAVRSCFTNSKVVEQKITSSVSPSVKVPSFKVVGAFGGREVTFTSEPGATVYYSTSSTMTSSDDHVKSGESVLFSNFYGTIYARSYKDGKWSNPARLILKIPVVNKPTITSSEGGYVTIKTTTPGCRIIYTTDGSTPSLTNGKVIYSSASKVHVGTGKTVKAIAVRSCFTNSDVTTLKN